MNLDEIWWGRVPGVIDAYDHTGPGDGGLCTPMLG